MSKCNKQEIIRLCQEINKKDGEGTIYTLDSKYSNLEIPRWSTGIEDLDSIIGGGMPEGRTVEIFGPESSGKTTLLYHLLARHPLALDVPVEGTFDSKIAKVHGNRRKQLIVSRAKFGENAYHQVIKFAKAGIPIVGIDSVPSLIPKENADKLMKAVNKDTIEEFRIGAIARLNEKYIPMLEDIIETTGTTVVFINQVRDKMDAMTFGEKTQTPGGRRLKHSCSLRIQVARKGWIEIPNKNPHNSATTEKIGIIMKCKVAKSKVCNPMGECEIPIIFERGVVSFDDIPKYRKELLAERAQRYGKRINKKDLEE